MSGAWAQFARTGQPGIALTGPWPSYGKERRATMIFDVETGVTEDPFAADREFWVRRAS
jgi:para-nitrobenzyl esterase